jgi:hypothetical protein
VQMIFLAWVRRRGVPIAFVSRTAEPFG